ncbi:MAG TPA: hypothetical protein VHJ17_15345 [Thermomonospora sp.]|nr:hypothetical protein [Thermomonospora sp.]
MSTTTKTKSPSPEHEAITRLFQDGPRLAADILRDLLHVPLPDLGRPDVGPNDIDEHQPLRRADAVIVFRDERDADTPALAVVVEVQRSRDPGKNWSWPAYVANARGRLRCPTYLLVVAPTKTAATWCATPIDLGHPRFTLTPLVVGPDQIPTITDAVRAAREMDLTTLSAIVHATDPEGAEIVSALMIAIRDVHGENGVRYAELVRAALPPEVWKNVEKHMKTEAREFLSEYTRTKMTESRAEALAGAVLRVLEARGVEVPAKVRAEIVACADLERLDGWLGAAVTVERAEDLLG